VVGDVLRGFERALVRQVRGDAGCSERLSFSGATSRATPNLDLSRIDWLIAGGESGPGTRPMHPDWVRQIRDLRANVPFFFKHRGGAVKSRTGRLLDGRTWAEMPGGLDAVVPDPFPILAAGAG